MIIIICKRRHNQELIPEFIKRTSFGSPRVHSALYIQQYVTSGMDVHVNDGVSRIEQLKKKIKRNKKYIGTTD